MLICAKIVNMVPAKPVKIAYLAFLFLFLMLTWHIIAYVWAYIITTIIAFRSTIKPPSSPAFFPATTIFFDIFSGNHHLLQQILWRSSYFPASLIFTSIQMFTHSWLNEVIYTKDLNTLLIYFGCEALLSIQLHVVINKDP